MSLSSKKLIQILLATLLLNKVHVVDTLFFKSLPDEDKRLIMFLLSSK